MSNHLLITGAGFVVGALIGLTGMGGGAIMTPFLILVMKINPVLAIGSDLMFAAITKTASGIQHHRQDNVDLRMVFWLALGSMPASFFMSTFVLYRFKGEETLQHDLARVLGVVLVLVSLYTLGRALEWIKMPERQNWPPPWALTALGIVGGGLVGLTSVGSGTIIMASLMIFFSIPAAQMVGLDVVHGALLTVVPATVYAFGGQVDWPLVGWMLLGSLPGAWAGSRLVSVVPQRVARGTLSVFLIVAGARLFL